MHIRAFIALYIHVAILQSMDTFSFFVELLCVCNFAHNHCYGKLRALSMQGPTLVSIQAHGTREEEIFLHEYNVFIGTPSKR